MECFDDDFSIVPDDFQDILSTAGFERDTRNLVRALEDQFHAKWDIWMADTVAELASEFDAENV
jgi:hypothetical protein